MSYLDALRTPEFRIASFHFLSCFGFKQVEQIVCFDSLAFTSGNFDMPLFCVIRRGDDTELFGTCWTERDDFVREMNRSFCLLFIAKREQPLANNLSLIHISEPTRLLSISYA